MAEGTPSGLGSFRDAIDQLRDELNNLHHRLGDAKQAFQEQVSNTPLTTDAAWELYWFEPDVTVEAIARGLTLGGTDTKGHAVWKLLGPGPIAATCDGCGEGVRRTSRSDAAAGKRWRSRELCVDCREAMYIERAEKSRSFDDQRRRHIATLRNLSYPEYLKTDHWQELRRQALRRAKYACQVCNAEGIQLDVHHRTYERRGEEWASDLIVLCHPCHGRHHGVVE